MTDIEIIEEVDGYAICQWGDHFTVVQISRKAGQVYSAMPTDGPADGGSWFAGISDNGVKYVAGWYSKGYARRIFRSLVSEAAELAEALAYDWEAA